MKHYYNEFDPKTAAWLRELMGQGHIPHGVIDGRSIKDVAPTDVAGEGQRHFFAGIGGWCESLRIAGWPASRNVWTGSCPCQPYSSAGKRKGSEDERDLWPDFYSLIRECKPETIIGEQVASGDVVGTELEAAFVAAFQAADYARANRLAERIAKLAAKRNESLDELAERWLDRVCGDLEAIGYAVWPIVFGAHSVFSPHKRQRLYWAAQPRSVQGKQRYNADLLRGRAEDSEQTGMGSSVDGLGHTSGTGSQERIGNGQVQRGAGCAHQGQATELSSHVIGLGDSDGSGSFAGDEPTPTDGHGNTSESTSGGVVGVVNTTCRREATAEQCGRLSGTEQAGYWSDYRVIQCRDGKARRIPVEPEFFPLAHGVPGRVGLLRGYGNAICVQTAAAFVRAFLETEVGAS